MDTLTHTLCGAAIARTSLGRRSPLSGPALMIAANLPDIDIVWNPVRGHDSYLLNHRGVSHSLLGLLVEALLFTWLVGWIERRRAAARGQPLPRRFAALLGIALALLSHILLDWLNNYGVRPWLPFSDTRYYGDLLSLVDPWIWLLFGGAVYFARGPHVRRVLLLATVALLAYLGARGAAREHAWARAEQDLADVLPPQAVVLDHVAQPDSLDWTRWGMVAATSTELVRLDVHLFGADGAPQLYARNLDDPRVALAAHGSAGRAWKYFARLPLAAVTPLPDGGARVDLMDGRYGLNRGHGWSTFAVTLTAADLAALPTPR